MSTLERAIAIAAEAHAGQVDKGGAPYILHPLRVMQKAFRVDEPDVGIVAVLHDVVEDCPDWPLERLSSAGLSPAAIEALDALTRRKEETYQDFVARCGNSRIATFVKLADLEDNMDLGRLTIITPRDEERLERYRKAHAALTSPLAPDGRE
ncbi:GTP pyrophosphokinase [Microvirga sp. M2]|uniref:GTP pyrophosphokinase n=1 Tax=Microvirga sp. M2 TaxID=3073270 RepID=UPI0039C0FD99